MSDHLNTCPKPCQDHPLCLVREAEELARLRAEVESLRALRVEDYASANEMHESLRAAESDAASLRERVAEAEAKVVRVAGLWALWNVKGIPDSVTTLLADLYAALSGEPLAGPTP